MFVGHYAVALASKRAVPAVSLGTLFLAAQLADLIWPNLVLAGIEILEIDPGNTVVTPLNFVSYPYSHSLVALSVWAVLAAVAYRLARGLRPAAMVVVGGLVLSHWVLDVVSHRPDVPVTLGGTIKLGFGLWNSLPATMIVETLLLGIGVTIYQQQTDPRDRTGSWGLHGLVAFLLLVMMANALGPPPPSVTAVAWTAQALWLLVAWGYWIERHRVPRSSLRWSR
jgi:hypothetical protein